MSASKGQAMKGQNSLNRSVSRPFRSTTLYFGDKVSGKAIGMNCLLSCIRSRKSETIGPSVVDGLAHFFCYLGRAIVQMYHLHMSTSNVIRKSGTNYKNSFPIRVVVSTWNQS
jgi:hypothetical protein